MQKMQTATCATHTPRKSGEMRRSGMGFQKAPDECCGVLTELAVLGGKGSKEMAVNIQFADDFAAHKDGDDNFRFRFKRAGQIARVVVDVIHDNCLAGGGSGSADTLIERDAGVGSHGAAKWAEGQNFLIAVFLNHVKADPIVFNKPLMQEVGNTMHQGVGI